MVFFHLFLLLTVQRDHVKQQKVRKKKHPAVKPNRVEQEVVIEIVPTKSRKGLLKKVKKNVSKKQSESKDTKPSEK